MNTREGNAGTANGAVDSVAEGCPIHGGAVVAVA